jgi:transposase
VIHKIKALNDNGNGLSVRAIAKELGISRNTVKKYLRMDEEQISLGLANRDRPKQLDPYFTYIKHLLKTFPELSAVKVMRKLKQKYDSPDIAERTLRRYVSKVRQEVCVAPPRYYEPVLDMVPGQQCQVDPGELRNVMIGGQPQTVYFVVFVLSFSRLMHLSYSLKPINTSDFIRMHDAALRYFGGQPEELVYAQTKLVVINEKYRELALNQRMAEYATRAGFAIRACEGYDPESKGKVESGVKYVKYNALYGESFRDTDELTDYLNHWLDNVANVRTHGTTGQLPMALYDAQERSKMRPYFALKGHDLRMMRKADKTGLISYQSNKYSVPMVWQRQQVMIRIDQSNLVILSPESGEEITRHKLNQGTGQILKNKHHYRDISIPVTRLEQQVSDQLGDRYGTAICALLKAGAPKIYRDQLNGLLQVVKRLGIPNEQQLERLCQRSQLTTTQLESLLEAMQVPEASTANNIKVSTGALKRYHNLTQAGEHHAFH